MRRQAAAAASHPTIVFCHANGFVAGTYSSSFEHWRAAGWPVLALPRFGHDPRYPVSSNWPHLRDELLHFVDQQALASPPVLVGHSMGGYISLLAACKKPGLARAIVLLDAPIVAGWRAHTVHVLKLSRLMQRGGPGKVSIKRRQHWPSAEAAWAHFAAKRAFAVWDAAVLKDYIQHGLQAAPEHGPHAVQLAFAREVETRIYNTLPHHLGQLLQRHPPRCPVAYIGGTRSPEGRQAGLAATRALVHERLAWVEGSHLFPMEQPEATAKLTLKMLEQLLA
jgi:pimeloyl-ACP methyl ester carboxylesterase